LGQDFFKTSWDQDFFLNGEFLPLGGKWKRKSPRKCIEIIFQERKRKDRKVTNMEGYQLRAG
jgi:hypothetical protein